MMGGQKKLIVLPEYSTQLFPESDIPYYLGEILWRNYGNQVAVEFPTPKQADNGSWLLKDGWDTFHSLRNLDFI
jgi:5-methylcytosine-specific restriction enzyme subunit McrC